MINDGTIVARPAQEDEKAMKLLRTLSIVTRRRWPRLRRPGAQPSACPRRRRRPPAPARRPEGAHVPAGNGMC